MSAPALAAATCFALGDVLVDQVPPFSVLYRRHYDMVHRWVRALGTPALHAEDEVQDVFMIVHRRLADFRSGGSFAAWLFGITRRVHHDHVRGRRRSEARIQKVDRSPAAPPRQDEQLLQRQAVSLVEEFLATLDDKQRMVFVLSEIDELSAPEVAEALGLPARTVRARLRLARTKFARVARRLRAQEERVQRESVG